MSIIVQVFKPVLVKRLGLEGLEVFGIKEKLNLVIHSFDTRTEAYIKKGNQYGAWCVSS